MPDLRGQPGCAELMSCQERTVEHPLRVGVFEPVDADLRHALEGVRLADQVFGLVESGYRLPVTCQRLVIAAPESVDDREAAQRQRLTLLIADLVEDLQRLLKVIVCR